MIKLIFLIFLPIVLSEVCKSTPEYKDILTVDPASSNKELKININHTCKLKSDTKVSKVFPDDYKYTEGIGAHKFHTVSNTFNEARKICNKEGGHLAVINSKAEEDILVDLFDKNFDAITGITEDGSHQSFIGVHSIFAENDWVTITGEPFDSIGYKNWRFPPPHGTSNDKCVSIFINGELYNNVCDYMFPFFCEIPEN